MKRFLTFVIVIAVLAMGVMADPEGANVTAGTPETANTSIVGSTVEAYGGNVTEVNLTAQAQTQRWQGFYGNIEGNITLRDSSGNLFYDWAVSTVQGEVYATSKTTVPVWASVGTFDPAPADIDTDFGWASTVADSANNTFTDNANTAFDVGSVTISATTRPSVDTYDDTGSGAWETVVIQDVDDNVTADYIYVGLIDEDATQFNANTGDFQIIVPEDNVGNTASTTYYFYVELS